MAVLTPTRIVLSDVTNVIGEDATLEEAAPAIKAMLPEKASVSDVTWELDEEDSAHMTATVRLDPGFAAVIGVEVMSAFAGKATAQFNLDPQDALDASGLDLQSDLDPVGPVSASGDASRPQLLGVGLSITPDSPTVTVVKEYGLTVGALAQLSAIKAVTEVELVGSYAQPAATVEGEDHPAEILQNALRAAGVPEAEVNYRLFDPDSTSAVFGKGAGAVSDPITFSGTLDISQFAVSIAQSLRQNPDLDVRNISVAGKSGGRNVQVDLYSVSQRLFSTFTVFNTE